MQFACEQDCLSRGLSIVNRAVARGAGAFPMATHIRISSDQGRIRLDATNLHIGITCWVEATIQNEGIVAVPALFPDLISALPPGKIEIAVNDASYHVTVHSPRGPVRVRGINPEEFPLMPSPDASAAPTAIKASLLKEVIKEVAIAIDETGAREIFCNILLQIEEQQITFVAADGHGKLAFRPLPLPTKSALSCDMLVPARSLIELASILPTEGMVEIRLTPNGSQIVFCTQQMVLSSILSSGTFPNYKLTLPKEKQTTVTVKTEEFRSVVRLTSLFAKADSDAGRVTIRSSMGVEPGMLTLASEAADIGGNCTPIPAAVLGEDQEELVFDIAHLARILSVIPTPEVIFEIGVTRGPIGLIRPAGAHTCIHSFSSMSAAR